MDFMENIFIFMFRFTTISILFVISLFLLIIEYQYGRLSGWWMVLPIVVYLLILTIGAFKIGAGFFLKSYCSGKADEKHIAITFDDGPDQSVTPLILELLKKHQVPATFFCTGQNVVNNPDLVRKLNTDGHLIGNHSYSHHRWFSFYSSQKMTEEIKSTNSEIEKATGKKPLLFRPPYGVTNPSVKKALEVTDMYSIGWSLRSFDTIKSAADVLKKLKRKTKAGDIVLFHDTDEKIIEIMKNYLNWLDEQQIKIVSLDQLLKIEAYEVV